MEFAYPPEWWRGLDNTHLRLIIFITEKCNFRCLYCYETFEQGRIHDSVVKGIKQLLAKRLPELKTLQLSFFGGEPLLHPEIITDLMAFALQRGQAQQAIQGDVTTNGYLLTPAVAQKLVRHQVRRFQITIDGLASTHNKLRPTAGGKPTFDTILTHVGALLEMPEAFALIIRCNVCDENYDSIADFLKQHRWLADPRISVHFHAVFGHPRLKLSNPGKKIQQLEQLAQSLGYQVVPPSQVCYASQGNVFVIRANGLVQKCTVALEHPLNTIGRLASNGMLNLNQNLLRKWVFSSDVQCPLRAILG